MKPLLIAILAAVIVLRSRATDLLDGDIIFHTSKSAQSQAVQAATGSKYSHMGMIVHRKGQTFVLEAAATVSLTPLQTWIARGEGGHYVVKRLKERAKHLTPSAQQKAEQVISGLMGKAYDLTFEWSDDRIYCSELVWKIYDKAMGVQIGAQQKLREFRLDAPAVQTKLKERYGDKVPLDEPVISPVAMFESALLESVVEK